MAAFADDDDAAAVDAILKQAPSSKIPELLEEASKRGLDARSDEAAALDEADPLREYRQQFCFPPPHNGRDAIYLCGHSLGLQPKKRSRPCFEDLERWAIWCGGPLRPGRCAVHTVVDHRGLRRRGSIKVGRCASRSEVVLMNSLTVNLHLLLSAFIDQKVRDGKY